MVGALTILGCDTSSDDHDFVDAEAQDLCCDPFSFDITDTILSEGFAELFGLPSGVTTFTLMFGEATGDILNVVLEAEGITYTGRVRVSGGICVFDFDPAEGENQPQDRTYSCEFREFFLIPPAFPLNPVKSALELIDDQASDATGSRIRSG